VSRCTGYASVVLYLLYLSCLICPISSVFINHLVLDFVGKHGAGSLCKMAMSVAVYWLRLGCAIPVLFDFVLYYLSWIKLALSSSCFGYHCKRTAAGSLS